MLVQSPNSKVWPASASINEQGHLCIGGVDAVELAERFGTPLYVMDEKTITDAIAAFKDGLSVYPGEASIIYAGKAFLCTAMCKLIEKHGLGLDVVSAGELYTASEAQFPSERLYLHGNNKSVQEVRAALSYGDVKIVVDGEAELNMVAQTAADMNVVASIFLRVIPGVEPDTHQHIVTGHADSKFGISLAQIQQVAAAALRLKSVRLFGLHAHIGSQAHEIEPYFEYIDIFAGLYKQLHTALGVYLPEMDIGGGLGIAYTDKDKTTSIQQWSKGVAARVASAMRARQLPLPRLLVEPGRAIVGTAGVTLYRAGHKKVLPSGKQILAVDGGMADNPRPITYRAVYTAALANRMKAPASAVPLTLAGRFCESGDIIIEETNIAGESGDLIAVFATGAYNYSMASNYNRTPRPACVLVADGQADVIIERETNADLTSHDRIPDRLR